MASDEQSTNEETPLVQCQHCGKYFTRELEVDGEMPEDSIYRHTCFIGGRRVELNETPPL